MSGRFHCCGLSLNSFLNKALLMCLPWEGNLLDPITMICWHHLKLTGFFSSKQEARILKVSQRMLPSLLSDHFLLILICDDKVWSIRYFKFETIFFLIKCGWKPRDLWIRWNLGEGVIVSKVLLVMFCYQCHIGAGYDTECFHQWGTNSKTWLCSKQLP